MQIRTFDMRTDWEAVLELWATAGPGIRLARSDEAREIRKKLRRDPDLFLVAEIEGRIVGAVLGGFDGRRGMAYHLAVANDFRKSGIGRALMAELEDRLREKGCLKYYLLVAKDNLEAVAFYQRFGAELMELNVMGKEIV